MRINPAYETPGKTMNVNDPVRIEYLFEPEGAEGFMMQSSIMPRGRAEATAKGLPQAKIIEINPNKESEHKLCDELNKIIEDYAYRTMLYGTGPQEVLMCVTDSLRSYSDLAGQLDQDDKKKNLYLMIEVMEAVTGNFDIHWITAGAQERKEIVEKIIQELKQIEVAE